MIEKIKQFFSGSKQAELSVSEKIDNIFSELGGDTITLKIGDDLVDFGDAIINIAENLRNDISRECGFILPAVHIFKDEKLQENEYIIQILEKDIFQDFIVPNIEGVEEIYGHLKEAVMSNLDDVFTNEVTEKYIDTAQRKNGWLIWALSYRLSSCEIKLILSDILKSGHSIKNINNIFERIGHKVLIEDRYSYTNPHNISKEIIKEL